MKTVYISQRPKDADFEDFIVEDDFVQVTSDFASMMSHIVYFSGEAKIKEVLIKKDASYSV